MLHGNLQPRAWLTLFNTRNMKGTSWLDFFIIFQIFQMLFQVYMEIDIKELPASKKI
jgi:hypothetical protein